MTTATQKRIVIVGGSFAGLTAAYELKRELGNHHRITVIDRQDQFVFIPSLIWLPFGWRTPKQITFPLRPALENRGIEFLQTTVERIDPARQVVAVADGR
ncbi:MAG TPA: FAD-dependent oxidoreductase, partial [Gemmata sp.]|nr:FAD-dependent oxidoreductase [Gemmata sp.]